MSYFSHFNAFIVPSRAFLFHCVPCCVLWAAIVVTLGSSLDPLTSHWDPLSVARGLYFATPEVDLELLHEKFDDFFHQLALCK